MPNLCISTKTPEKIEEFHKMIIPPEAPIGGENTKLSNHLGQNFLIRRQLKLSHLVS
jgi:hypothetical protein